MDYQQLKQDSVTLHREHQGKIETTSRISVKSKHDLSLAYSPGVAEPCILIKNNPQEANNLTLKGRTIAVISDGSAVLGLGNIGGLAGLPVMEGKSLLFKEFAGLDSFPIVLDTQDTEEIIRTIKAIAPTFGGINLEDISAPRCFEIEERLKAELDIPIMHDDQHGTAIVVLAGLLNALKVVHKNLADIQIVISGPGAAGTAVAKLLSLAGAKNIILLDSKGILSRDRIDLNDHKQKLLEISNPKNISGNLRDALRNADVFIGVSGPNIATKEDIQLMANDGIVFALANPVPEIMPEEAKAGGARIVATGRSDYPNQVNNVLAFPGIFRGAIDGKKTKITDTMKLAAAHALSGLIETPTEEMILPDAFDPRVVHAVAEAVMKS
ncbi:MAG: NADP-dependent malic enzyme [Candidatus Gracilibacteria bacterium]